MNTLLFIEDEANQRELTTRLYQMCGKVFHGEVEFLTSATWREGLEIIRARHVDVLLLDLVLANDTPPLSWQDTLEAVRTTPDLPPVVILSGMKIEPFIRDKCILSGADSFMDKQEANHRPETLCEKCYDAYLRRQRDLRWNEPRA